MAAFSRELSKCLIWVLLVMFTSIATAQDEELLEPDKAFALSVQANSANHVTATWDIADGYYMYRDKFHFKATNGGMITDVTYPKGKIKSDEFFGDVEVYVHQARFELALDANTSNVSLTLEGQGCNEPVGVCYPPLIKNIVLTLPAANAASATSTDVNAVLPGLTSSTPLSSPVATPVNPALEGLSGNAAGSDDSVTQLRNLLGNLDTEDEFLPVDEAFKLDLSALDGRTLAAQFKVADGYYLYRDKITFKVNAGDAQTGQISLPPGEQKNDEFFGLMSVYHNDFDATVPLLRSSPQATTISLTAGYQGCADKGICYPPVTREFNIDLPVLVAAAEAAEPASGETAVQAKQSGSAPATGSNDAAGRASTKSLIGYLVAAFGVGLLLTFTPCVLPMIPILSSIIVGQGASVTHLRGGLLAFIYVLGTTVTYAAIGWVAGATGDQLQAYFQNIWAIGALALVFVVLSLSMFGLFKIQMPSFIQSRLSQKSAGLSGGTAGMVFVLGLMSALIVGACVSPLLISLLAIAITQGDPLLGALMMSAMSFGMGVFLVAIGFGAGFLLPRAGAWMERVNYVFGVMLLAVAIYLLGAIPEVPVLLLWSALMIVVAVYLGATQSIPQDSGGLRYLQKGLGIILLVWGVVGLIGGLIGGRDIMHPLPAGVFNLAQTSSSEQPIHEELFARVGSPAELDAEFAAARAEGRHVMLDFYADWCTDCIRMEKTTFVDPQVKNLFDQSFHLVQVDVTDPNDPGGKAIKQRYGVYGPPAILFFKDGNEVRDLRLYGYRDKDTFIDILRKL
ncbi:MAG: hypothetical protein DHS20C01_11120 [marine bacterium B5-7]|nr:MAG: hypothetical protein DHS20C01_11120 [marine bacterium B5-7]